MDAVKTKRRYPSLAFILSCIFPGTGFIYIGEFKKAIYLLFIWYAAFVAVVLLFSLIGRPGYFVGIFSLVVIAIYTLSYPVIVAYQKKHDFTPTRHNKFRYYLFYIFTSYLFSLLILSFITQPFRIPGISMNDTLLTGDCLYAKKFAYGISTPRSPFLEIPLFPGTDGHIIDGDEPKHGDIVIFRYPHNTSLHYVKRCVAVPGDEVFVKDKNLYLHPHEGNAFAKEHYPKATIVKVNGELWVKNPYMKAHPGIHHDPNVSNDSPILLGPNGEFQPIRTKQDLNRILSGKYQLPKGVKFLKHNPIFDTDIYKVPPGSFFMMGDNRDHSDDSRFWGPVPYGLIEGTPWFIYFSMDSDYNMRLERFGKTIDQIEQGI